MNGDEIRRYWERFERAQIHGMSPEDLHDLQREANRVRAAWLNAIYLRGPGSFRSDFTWDDDVPPILNSHEGGSMADAQAPMTETARTPRPAPPLGRIRRLDQADGPMDGEAPGVTRYPQGEEYAVRAFARGHQGGAFRLSDGTIVVRIGCQMSTVETWRYHLEHGEYTERDARSIEAFLVLAECELAFGHTALQKEAVLEHRETVLASALGQVQARLEEVRPVAAKEREEHEKREAAMLEEAKPRAERA